MIDPILCNTNNFCVGLWWAVKSSSSWEGYLLYHSSVKCMHSLVQPSPMLLAINMLKLLVFLLKICSPQWIATSMCSLVHSSLQSTGHPSIVYCHSVTNAGWCKMDGSGCICPGLYLLCASIIFVSFIFISSSLLTMDRPTFSVVFCFCFPFFFCFLFLFFIVIFLFYFYVYIVIQWVPRCLLVSIKDEGLHYDTTWLSGCLLLFWVLVGNSHYAWR